MKVEIKLTGFEKGAASFRRASRRFSEVLEKELQRFGDESVAYLKEAVSANLFDLPPKASGRGIPLIDSGKYISGYIAVVDGRTLGIYSQGMNDHMTNADLGELLEYGNGAELPPRPHLRPLWQHMQQRSNVLGERVYHGLFGDF